LKEYSEKYRNIYLKELNITYYIKLRRVLICQIKERAKAAQLKKEIRKKKKKIIKRNSIM
jgi:hypothetical protein